MKKLVLFLLVNMLCLSVFSQTTVIFSEDFNGSTHQMTSSQTVVPGTPDYRFETTIYSSLLKSIFTPMGGNAQQATLTTAYIPLPSNATNIYLNFKHICKVIHGSLAQVKYSVTQASGTNTGWIVFPSTSYIGPSTLYGTGTRFSQFSYPDLWEGVGGTQRTDAEGTPTNSWWVYETFDIKSILAAYPGATHIAIQFGMGNVTNPTTQNPMAGWYIDDITIRSSMGELIPPTITPVATPVIYDKVIYNNTGPFTITADIADPSNFIRDSVYLKYKIDDGSHIDAVRSDIAVISPTAERYQWTIPQQVYGTKIRYDIWGTDVLYNRGQLTKEFLLEYQSIADIVIGDSNAVCTTQYVLATNYQNERNYAIYTASELAPIYTNNGLSPSTPLSITGIRYKIMEIPLATSAAYPYTIKVYAGMTAANTVSTTTAFPTTDPVATVTITSADIALGWKYIPFETQVPYTGGNLYVSIEKTAASSSGNTMVRCSTTGSNLFGYATSAATNVATTSTSRPVIWLSAAYPAPTNDLELVSFQAPGSSTMAGNQPVTIVMRNKSVNEMTQAVIGWSVDGVDQTPYTWNANPPTVTAPLDFDVPVTIGNYNFPAGTHCIEAWVISRNGAPDNRPINDVINMCTYVCTEQLSGNAYTLGGAPGTVSFTDFDDLKEKLIHCGVAGPTVIHINPGTYGNLVLDQVYPGMSATNTVTFTSATTAADVIITDVSTTLGGAVVLSGTQGFIFNNLTVKGREGGTVHSRAFYFTGAGNRNITISNCIITAKDSTTASTLTSISAISRESGSSSDQVIRILNNSITGGNFGIRFNAGSSTRAQQIEIKNNTITTAYRGIFSTYADLLDVSSNVIRQKSNSTAIFSGIHASNSLHAGTMEKNKIYIPKTTEYGIYLSNLNTGGTSRYRISNNEIRGKAISDNKAGLYMVSCEATDVINNSIMLRSDNNFTGSTYSLWISAGKEVSIKNNILSNLCVSYANTNYAYFMGTKPTGTFISDYNNLYSSGSNVGYYNSAARADIAAWRTATSTDDYSVSVLPHYADTAISLLPLVYAGMECPTEATVPDDINGNARGVGTYMGAYSIVRPALDVAITALVAPANPPGCPDVNSPVTVRIQNGGSQTIDFAVNTVTIKTTLSGAITYPETPYTIPSTAGTLAPLATMDVTVIPNIFVPVNEPLACQFIVNMPGDQVLTDDSLQVTFLRSRIAPIYDQNFSAAPDPVWTVESSSTTYKWEFQQGTTPAPAPVYGTGRMYFNSSAAPAGTTTRATMPLLTLVGTHQPILEFWFAHSSANSTRADSVTVKVSTDGGTTYQSLLQVQRYNSDFSTAGWKKYTVDLSAYTTSSCVIIAFDGVSRAGGAMSIDRVLIRNIYANDIAVRNIYPLGDNPTGVQASQKIKARIENTGTDTQTNVAVTLNITGANTYTETLNIPSIARDEIQTVVFNGSYPVNAGNNNVKVSVAADNNPDTENNEQNWLMVTSPRFISHIEDTCTMGTTTPASTKISAVARFKTDEMVNVPSVKVYVTGITNIGKKFRAFVANPARTKLSTSDIITITPFMIDTWVEAPINNYALTNLTGDVYVGIEMQETGNYIGVQATEDPLRDSASFTYTTSAYTPYTAGKFMIGADLLPASPHDFSLISINGLVSSCGMGVDSIRITYTNNGYQDIPAGTTLNYSVNGLPTVSTQLTDIVAAHQTYNFTFPTPFDFFNSLIGQDITFNVKVWATALPTDYIQANDTLVKAVLSLGPHDPLALVTPSPVNVNFFETATIQAVQPAEQGIIKWFSFEAPNTWNELASSVDTYTTPPNLRDTTYYASFTPGDFADGTIGMGTTTNTYYPFVLNYGYSRGKQLFTSTEMGGFGQIQSISFEVVTPSQGGIPIKMYVKQVPENSFTTAYNWATDTSAASGALKIYDGDYMFTAGWNTIEFPEPFNYTSGNFVILTEQNCGGYSCAAANGGNSTYPTIKQGGTYGQQVVRYYQDGTLPGTSITYSNNTYGTRWNIKYSRMSPAGCPSNRAPIEIHVVQPPTYDVATLALEAPESGCGLSQENVTIRVQNILHNTIPAGKVIVKADLNGTVLTDTINTPFAPNEIKTVTFTQTFDATALLQDITVDWTVWTDLANETNVYRLNDTIDGSFTSFQTGYLTAFPDVAGEYTQPYLLDPDLGYATYMYYASETAADALAEGTTYLTPAIYETTTYWISAAGGDVVTVGTGTSTAATPFTFGWGYSRGKILYTAAEVGGHGPISRIAINVTTAATGALPVKIWIKQVPENILTSAYTWAADTSAASGAVKVYDHTLNGNLLFAPTGWMTFSLSQPFNFNSGNLLILTQTNCGGSSCSSFSSTYPSFQYTSATTGMVAYYYQDSNEPGATIGSAYTSGSRWNMKFYKGCLTNRVPQKVTIAVPDYDLETVAVLDSITNRCGIGSEKLWVRLKNTRNNTIPANIFKVAVNIDGTVIEECVNATVGPYATLDYQISTPFDFTTNSGDVTYNYTAYTTECTAPVHQIYRRNDTVQGSFYVLANPLPPASIVMNGEYGHTNVITPSDPFLNQFYFYNQQSGGTLLGVGESFTTPVLYETTTYWMSGSIVDETADEYVQIGTGTSNINYPFLFNWGYSRGKLLYTASEVEGYGLISKIAINVGTAASGALPIKLWIKQVPENILTSDYTWAADTAAANGAVKIYDYTTDGNLLFAPTGWMTFSLPQPFNFTSGNLMILTQSNCGGTSCSSYGGSTYPTFQYTSTTNGMVAYYYQDTNEPGATISSKATTGSRWNIRITKSPCQSEKVPVVVNIIRPDCDVAITEITSPVSPPISSAPQPVTVTITNYGNAAVSVPFTVGYFLEGQPVVEETYTGPLPIASGASITYTFASNVDFSLISTVFPSNFYAYVHLGCDEFSHNDTLRKTIDYDDPCASRATSALNSDISRFRLANIANGPGTPRFNYPANATGYSDYTQTIDPIVLYKNRADSVYVTISYAGSTASANNVRIYIDTDHDNAFNATGELYFTGSVPGNTGTVPEVAKGVITVPVSALTGYTRLRVVAVQGTTTPSPCGTYTYGETEDYTVLILEDVPNDLGVAQLVHPVDTVCADENARVKVLVKNYGTETQTFSNMNVLTVNAIVSGTSSGNYSTTVNSGSLAPNESMVVALPGVDLSRIGDYVVSASIVYTGDQTPQNNVRSGSAHVKSLFVLPTLSEDFETGVVGGDFPDIWTINNDDATFMWKINSGRTPEYPQAGPSYDNTHGPAAVGKYAYVPGTDQPGSVYTTLTSACVNLHYDELYSKQLNYYEHVYGKLSATSKVYVQVGSGRNFVTVDSIINRTKASSTVSWDQRRVILPDIDENAQVRFRVERGTDTIDVAIDDLNITVGAPDVGIASIIAPEPYVLGNTGSCQRRGEQMHPKVILQNYGIVPTRGFPVKAVLQYGYEQETIEDYWGGSGEILMPGESVEFLFSTYFIVPTIDYNNLQVFTDLPQDANPLNDRKSVNICTDWDPDKLDEYDGSGAFLGQNIPNPAATATRIPYYIPEAAQITLSIYSMEGQLLYSESANSDEGEHYFDINTTAFAQGVYAYVLEYKEYRMVKKMVIQK